MKHFLLFLNCYIVMNMAALAQEQNVKKQTEGNAYNSSYVKFPDITFNDSSARKQKELFKLVNKDSLTQKAMRDFKKEYQRQYSSDSLNSLSVQGINNSAVTSQKKLSIEDLLLLGGTAETNFSSFSQEENQTMSATASPISYNLPVGRTKGDIAVTLTGGATYSIPIAVPPGLKEMTPNVNLVYNSQAGLGVVGMGWMIGSSSIISRSGQMHYLDGKKFGYTI